LKNSDKKEQPKERIMRSAKKEFSHRGFNGARMSSIARGASVNKALIHYYFKDKETLYLGVLTSIFRGADAAVSLPAQLGKWELTPSQKLYIIIYFVVNIVLKATDPDAMRIIFWELAEGKRYLNSLIMEYNIPRQKIISSVVFEGVAKGEFETDYPLLAAMNIGSFIAFYSINKEFYQGSPIFRSMYGDAEEKDAFQYVLESVFKSLRPKNRELDIPEIPGDLKILLEELLRVLVEKQDEGHNEEVLRRVESLLQKNTAV
jgi:TetR/AcrR family transcriptional regulator